MRNMTLKSSILWTNIGDVAVQTGKLAVSGYQYAHFYGSIPIPSQNPVLLI